MENKNNKQSDIQFSQENCYPHAFLTIISDKLNVFPYAQKKVAQAFLKQPELLSCFSLVELSERIGSSQATIIRFCRTLGFSGFLQFTKEVQQSFQAHLTLIDRFPKEDVLASEEKITSDLKKLMDVTVENLESLHECLYSSQFIATVKAMIEADHIYIAGHLASSTLALHFYHLLSKIIERVTLFDQQNMMTVAAFNRMTSKSLVFVIAYPRYPVATLKIAQQATQYGATIISITNSLLCPTVPLSKYALLTPITPISYIDLFASPITLLSALTITFAHSTHITSQRILQHFDIFAKENNFFVE